MVRSRVGKYATLIAALVASALAAPRVDKVEPPNWWSPHTYNPVRVLLTGDDLKAATVTTKSKGFHIDARGASANGHYLFVYLNIARNVAAGEHRFEVRSASGTTEFTFRIDRPPSTQGRYQGFSGDDVIYLLMPDRFANGDPSNDGVVNRDAVQAYHGGDLRGLKDHLPYLKDLGATGVWMTPVYKNVNAYHGYHTVDFYDVEPRFGTMAEMRELVDAAHAIGIKVVQDQVANHSGPRHPWVVDPPTPTWFNGLDRQPRVRNNFDIVGLADPYARPKRREVPLRGWFAGSLPDFNQDDPLVTDYLIQNALWWIGMTGIDAIRQDTYPYVDRPFWEKWQSAIDKQYPGFTVVGEITAPTPASLSFFEGGTRRNGVDTKLPSMLDFPLQRAVREVFAQGQTMTKLTEVLAQDSLYQHPERLVAFVGNHDGPRMLTVADSNVSRLLMAQAFLLTTRRVVHLYYGDEIAMGKGADRTDRSIRADFPVESFKAEGRSGDAAMVFDKMREWLHFRQEHPALRRGALTQLLVNAEQYAYLRTSPEEYVLVLLNRASTAKPVEIDVDDLGFPEGLQWTPPLTIANGKAIVAQPAEVQMYWAARPKPRR